MKHSLHLAGLLAGLLTVACASSEAEPAPAPTETLPVDPWAASFEPPTVLETSDVYLEPLGPQHAELDFEAFMSSREHLQATLHWGSWPSEDSTVEGNRGDLERHAKEFDAREAYAYTVLSKDRSRCVGCVYINPGETGPDGYVAAVAYWVVEDELANDLDAELVANLLTWFETEWPFAKVGMPLHPENERGCEIALAAGLTEEAAGEDGHRRFTWSR